MPATEFTPLVSLAGGAMIGLSAVLMMLLNGRIAGISGIASQLLPPGRSGDTLGRAAFLLGLVLAPFLVLWTTGHGPDITVTTGTTGLVISGLLVGLGTVVGNGCTSGHGVCGLARLSRRSMVAVVTFMATAMITAFILRHIVGVV